MNKLKKAFLYYRARLQSIIGVALLIIIATVSVFHYILFNSEMEQFRSHIVQNDETYTEIKWKLIESTLKDADYIADISAREAANDIVSEVEKRYPDKSDLRLDLEAQPDVGFAFGGIIVDVIGNRFLYDIDNYENSLTVFTRDRVLADMNPITNAGLTHSFEYDKIYYGKNPYLYNQAIDAIINHKDNNRLIFYEPLHSGNPDHKLITKMKLSELRKIYVDEGFEGLSTYTFLAPYYITDKGDIFGTPDYNGNGFTNNHKMVVVQKFNIVDIMNKQHPGILESIDRERDSIDADIRGQMEFKAITYLANIGVNIFALFCVIFFLSATHGGRTKCGRRIPCASSTIE